MKNYYHILGLRNLASMNEIKAAYRKLALVHHPDRGGSTEKMQEINNAYDYLVKNKESYDETLRPSRPELRKTGFTIIVNGWGASFSMDGATVTTSTGGW